ncbi:hypothetical protein [Streptomyces sp. NPDC046371]|uniref:hypothetical protein n=1 Tax=Streptomyces sp. NPDC046371 TaxID=3154916 RepID=UPI003409A176
MSRTGAADVRKTGRVDQTRTMYRGPAVVEGHEIELELQTIESTYDEHTLVFGYEPLTSIRWEAEAQFSSEPAFAWAWQQGRRAVEVVLPDGWSGPAVVDVGVAYESTWTVRFTGVGPPPETTTGWRARP